MKNILSKSLSSYIIIYFTTSFFFDTNGTAKETSRLKKEPEDSTLHIVKNIFRKKKEEVSDNTKEILWKKISIPLDILNTSSFFQSALQFINVELTSLIQFDLIFCFFVTNGAVKWH